MQLIIIAGQAGVGKTTLAHIIAAEVFGLGLVPKLLSFAGPLKAMADEKGYSKDDNPKEYRKFCQSYGAAKRAVNDNYWIEELNKDIKKASEEEAKAMASSNKYWERCVIIDDCRYPNEVEYGLNNKGTLIFLSSGNRKIVDPKERWRNHHSEDMAKLIDNGAKEFRKLFNCLIKNQGTIENLREKVHSFVPLWCGVIPTDNQEYKDEHVDDLTRCITELIDLLLLGKLDEEEDDEEET